ncbi:MAG: GNAT family N-acetyltransferase [Candidatus Marinimicrobia bacterium]|jgi:ribosomal protein S18 acetylase RimI-like enzyme|nr:GNAT family N-acetyltransferase [Candidatus Neomarinimicrobiota bacterium]
MINIRSIKPEDRSVLLHIIEQTNMFSPAEVDVAMELIDVCLNQKEQKDYTINVATDETDSIVGYVCYGPTPATIGTFDLYWIVVDVVCQNQGIGKQLLQFVECEVSQKVGRLIVIETSSVEKYLPTRGFYLRNGYTIAAQIKDFYREGDDRVIFVKYFKPKEKE